MKVVVEYQGKRYESAAENAGRTHKEAAADYYGMIEGERKLNMQLADGSIMVLGELALQSAVVIFLS